MQKQKIFVKQWTESQASHYDLLLTSLKCKMINLELKCLVVWFVLKNVRTWLNLRNRSDYPQHSVLFVICHWKPSDCKNLTNVKKRFLTTALRNVWNILISSALVVPERFTRMDSLCLKSLCPCQCFSLVPLSFQLYFVLFDMLSSFWVSNHMLNAHYLT